MTRTVLIATALVLAAPSVAAAQSDSQLWSEASASHALSKKWEVGFGQHLRFDDGASRLAAIMPEVAASFEAADWLRFGGGYRFMYKRDDSEELGFRHRLHVDGRARHDRERVRFELRHRWQSTSRDFDAGGGRFTTMRNRVQVEWRRKGDVRPAASFELFHRVGDGNGIERRARRLTFGVDIDMGDYDLDVSYRHEQPYNDKDDVPLHIIAVGVSTEL